MIWSKKPDREDPEKNGFLGQFNNYQLLLEQSVGWLVGWLVGRLSSYSSCQSFLISR
jgi:hypothetical protein